MPASTEVKYFHHKMKGAPVIDGSKGSIITLFNALLVDGFDEQTATSVSVSGNVATVTLADHGFGKHTVISISGATPAQLNGEHRVTKSVNDSFQFETVGVADGAASGTIKVKYAPAGWKKVAQSADGFRAVYKSERLGFDQPFFMVIDDENQGYGFNVVPMSRFENFEDYDTSVQGHYRTRFVKKNSYPKVGWAVLVNDYFLYQLIDNSYPLNYVFGGNLSEENGTSCGYIQCFGVMKTTKANNKYNGVVSGGAINASDVELSAVLDTKNLNSRGINASGGGVLIQRNYTSIGDPTLLGSSFSFTSGDRGSSSLGVVNAADYAVYIQRPFMRSESVAYGYLPGFYYTYMSYKPHKTEPVFVENVGQIQPDNMLMWWPTGVGGVYFNATKW